MQVASGQGANTFQRPDGLFITIHANNGAVTAATDIFDPFLMQFTSGPLLNAAAGVGSFNFIRPDGRIEVEDGNSVGTSSIYDAATNTFTVGPALTTGGFTTGATPVQLSTGRILVPRGGAATTQILSIQLLNTWAVGPVDTGFSGTKMERLPFQSRTEKYFSAGQQPQRLFLPIPMRALLTPRVISGTSVFDCCGGFVLQRPRTEHTLICGNSANTAVIDAGWIGRNIHNGTDFRTFAKFLYGFILAECGQRDKSWLNIKLRRLRLHWELLLGRIWKPRVVWLIQIPETNGFR